MPILNYTTTIDAIKTTSQIQSLLAAKGAHSIATDYAEGEPSALVFHLMLNHQDLAYRLPCNWRGVLQTMNRDKKCPLRYKTNNQAKRVAWRIVKDWVEAQLAIIESGQAEAARFSGVARRSSPAIRRLAGRHPTTARQNRSTLRLR